MVVVLVRASVIWVQCSRFEPLRQRSELFFVLLFQRKGSGANNGRTTGEQPCLLFCSFVRELFGADVGGFGVDGRQAGSLPCFSSLVALQGI